MVAAEIEVCSTLSAVLTAIGVLVEGATGIAVAMGGCVDVRMLPLQILF